MCICVLIFFRDPTFQRSSDNGNLVRFLRSQNQRGEVRGWDRAHGEENDPHRPRTQRPSTDGGGLEQRHSEGRHLLYFFLKESIKKIMRVNNTA